MKLTAIAIIILLAGCGHVHHKENSFGLHWGHAESVDMNNINQG